ncbi:MAG: DUF362 domain-containing protein [Planctomycetes bacterium]|nr:DUF362 domain-containing protein [Planctomycetota bacterium]
MAPHRVIIRHCPTYDPDRIRAIVREGLEELDLRPRGRVLVKPNIVIAHRQMFPHAYTRPEFIDGVLGALRDREEPGTVEELAVGERCGITIPTRMAWKQAGYPAVVRRHRARRYFFDEVTQVEVPLRHPDRLRDYLYTPEPVARADFFVNCPKFKAHPWTTVTFCLKNYIGIQDDRHRLIDHDFGLDRKVADLQEVVQPRFVAIDAIVAGEGRMLTPRPFDLQLVILGDNQVAVDAACCRIIGVDPTAVPHIALCAGRGYGSLDAADARLGGDVGLDEAAARAKGFQVGLVRVERYFEGSRIRAHAGPPPAQELTDYCWGGCPGAMEEAIEIIRQLDQTTDRRMRPLTVVFGAYEGPLEPRPGERVIFMGDCARWKGRLDGREVDVQDLYVERHHKDPCHARVTDVFLKMGGVLWNLFRSRKDPHVRVRGCPVSVAEQTLYLAQVGGTRNPYLLPATAIPFALGWTGWRLRRLWRWVTLQPYQRRDAGGRPRG